MFTLLSGHFHPHLESKLVETVQQIKAADARTPFAIVVPSESLRRRLQWLICVEHGCALFNVHFFTFHQLGLRLAAERGATSPPGAPVSSLELVGGFFYEYALSVILQRDSSATNPFALCAESSGLLPALWRTIQDLQEAQVEPHVVLRGLEEGLFDEAATERLQGVVGLQAMLQAWSEQLGVGLPDDLTRSIIPWVAQSPFIGKLSSVLYYGFYDITQVQLSLLEEVARATAVTVFFPLFKGDTSQFAQRFFDRHLLKAGVVHHDLAGNAESSTIESTHAWTPHVQVVNAVGPEGELTFACKAIAQQVEETGYAWHEIGVVARNLEPYLSSFPRMFDAYRIPFGTSATRPILEEPSAKLWWTLAGLQEEKFAWRTVLDVVTSPWYRGMPHAAVSISAHAHVWVQAVHYFRIIGGQEDWVRLGLVAKDSIAIEAWQPSSGVSLDQASDSLRLLAEMVDALIADCQALPAVGSIGELTEAFQRLVERLLWPLADHPLFGQDDGADERSECVMHGFEEAIHSLQQLDRVDQQVTWEQWVELFRSLLERTRLPLLGQTSMGVQVLEVMAARGRPFKTLVVLGMNDHVFPRIVREDALLRDRDRKVLAESLGYKIDEKMTGFDEEALLFALLQHSARDHLYLLYQRADGNGRPLIPSSFLREHVVGPAAQHAESEITFPVGLLKRPAISSVLAAHETPQESRLGSILQGRSIQSMAATESPWWSLFQNGMEVIPQLERTGTKAGACDGIIAVNSLHWQELISRGFSPTALGTYAQCPMRYWMMQVLKVQRLEDLVSNELSSRIWGELVHQVLCEIYQDLARHRWPNESVSPVQLADILNLHVNHVFQKYAQRFGTGYRLIWDWMRLRLIRMMGSLLERDQRDFLEQGWVPSAYEVEAAGTLPRDGEEQPEVLNIRGRFDRVDEGGDHSRLRIVDYKVSMRRTFQADELDLVTKALQGRQLQPPLYSFMTPMPLQREAGASVPGTLPIQSVDFRYLRPMQDESVHTASFSGAIWETAVGDQLRRTIHQWVQGIRAGQFFILPGAYCRSCQYASACRFQHHPSWSRAYGLPLAKTYRQIRKQKAFNDK
ncbi:MAG: exodeoxyribonuclease V subunit gamma [Nitrospirota bacterium]|nr:exodeoxyribonuclease V subunit gamma [Nitrospirota bacterium]